MFKRFLAVFMSFTLLFSMVTVNASANEEVSTPSATKAGEELNIQYTGENSWIYSQEIEGNTFRIQESIDLDTNVINTRIEKLEENGEYALVENIVSTPKEKSLELKRTNKSGKESIDYIETKSIEEKINMDDNSATPMSNELTPWTYTDTYYHDINFAAITIGIVSGAIAAALGLGVGASIVVSAATGIVAEQIPQVYTKQIRSHKNVVGTTILAGIMDDNYVYEHSNFTGLLAYNQDIDCAEQYSCE